MIREIPWWMCFIITTTQLQGQPRWLCITITTFEPTSIEPSMIEPGTVEQIYVWDTLDDDCVQPLPVLGQQPTIIEHYYYNVGGSRPRANHAWTRHKWADICWRYKGRWLSITITTFGSTNGDHCRHDQHCKCNNDGQHSQYDCHDHDLQWTWLCNHDEYVLRLPLLSQPFTRVVHYHYHDQHCKRNHDNCAMLLPLLS